MFYKPKDLNNKTMTFCVANESKQIDQIEVQTFKLLCIDKEDYDILAK